MWCWICCHCVFVYFICNIIRSISKVWSTRKRLEKKLDGNYTRMLREILNKSWRQHSTRHQLYGHPRPITKSIQVRRTRPACRPAFARPYVGVHRSTSLMSSSLILQQCPASLVRLTWIVFLMGGRWPYSWCLVGCYRLDLFNIARSILL